MYSTLTRDTQRYAFLAGSLITPLIIKQVGGLPLPELNHLELQFLLLNDFRLSIPVEELEAYGTMLVEFYAREIVGQQQSQPQLQVALPADSDAMYMRSRDTRQPEVHQTSTPP